MNAIGITDDAASILEHEGKHSKASPTDTTNTTIEHAVVGHYGGVFDETGRHIQLSDIMPQYPLGTRGHLEIRIQFTPEAASETEAPKADPCRSCQLRHTCTIICADRKAWLGRKPK